MIVWYLIRNIREIDILEFKGKDRVGDIYLDVDYKIKLFMECIRKVRGLNFRSS